MKTYFQKLTQLLKQTKKSDKIFTISLLIGYLFVLIYSLFPATRENNLVIAFIVYAIFGTYSALVLVSSELLYQAVTLKNLVFKLLSLFGSVVIGFFSWGIGTGLAIGIFSWLYPTLNTNDIISISMTTSTIITIVGNILTVLYLIWKELRKKI